MSLEKTFCQLRQRHRCGFQWRPAKPTGRAGGGEFILPTRMCSNRKLLSQQQSENYRHLLTRIIVPGLKVRDQNAKDAGMIHNQWCFCKQHFSDLSQIQSFLSVKSLQRCPNTSLLLQSRTTKYVHASWYYRWNSYNCLGFIRCNQIFS